MMSEYKRYRQAKCTAIYLGGGTASLLNPMMVSRLIQMLIERFNIDPNCEITLEGNPIDFTNDYLSCLTSITRLSIGLQSLDENTLKIIGTRHNAIQANDIIKRRPNMFKAVNVDFIYGIKGSDSPLLIDLKRIIDEGFQSITFYCYDSPTHSIEKTEAWGRYLNYKEFLAKHNFFEKMFGFFTNGYNNVYNENQINAKEMIGFGPGSYSFINDYMVKYKNNYKEYMDTPKLITHRSNRPDRQMRLDTMKILCNPSIDLKDRIAARMGITERLDGYPYF